MTPDAPETLAELRAAFDARGAQSQTLARFPEGWRIVAAHVSLEPPE